MGGIRVLHVLGNLRRGGAESFVLNLYRNINHSEIQFDFITRGNNDENLVKEINNMGGKVFNLPAFPRHIFKNYRELRNFLKREGHKYDAIHVHANSLLYVKPLKLAKKYGISCRIIHSHNTETANKIYKVIHYLNRIFINRYATKKLACSSTAGKWMFSKGSFEVIKNAINIDNFTYNKSKRDEIRKKLSLEDNFAVGNIGRFVRQKNHAFLIDVFEKIYKENNKSRLILIGEGDLEESIKNKVKEKRLESAVIFVGPVSNPYDYLQGMDVFLFPSLFEGLGIVLIEAESSGLPVVASNVIPEEAVIIKDNVKLLSLKDSNECWARNVLNYSKDFERKAWREAISKAGYDIEDESKRLISIYKENSKV